MNKEIRFEERSSLYPSGRKIHNNSAMYEKAFWPYILRLYLQITKKKITRRAGGNILQ